MELMNFNRTIVITNRKLCHGDYLEQIEKAVSLGPKALILREKDLSDQEYEALAKSVSQICEESGVEFFPNCSPERAMAMGYHKVHMPFHVFQARHDASVNADGTDMKTWFDCISVACHSAEEAVLAESLGADRIILGTIFETNCKPGKQGEGLDFLQDTALKCSIPVYAIGGIKPENLNAVIETGAAGGCMMSWFMNTEGNASETEKQRKPMNIKREQLRLYAITDSRWLNGRTLAECVEDALKGGITMLQLREKELDYDSFKREALEIQALCKSYGVPLIINDNVELAKEIDADGVHVGQSDLEAGAVRSLLGPDKIIGVTAKTIEQAKRAQEMGADYLGSGAVFGTGTKADAKPMDLSLFRTITDSVSIPVVAIGGINSENIERLENCGAVGAAIVSGIFAADDIRNACESLREKCFRLFL